MYVYAHQLKCMNVISMSNLQTINCVNSARQALTHKGGCEIDAILQTIFWNALSWIKMLWFLYTFHWNIFPRVQLTIFQHWLRWWLGADQAASHYLNQWWLFYWRMYASLGINELKMLIKPSRPMSPQTGFRLRCNQCVPDFHPVFRLLRQPYGTQSIDQANAFLALHKIGSQVSVSSHIFWHDIHRGLYSVTMKTWWNGNAFRITCEGIPPINGGFAPVMQILYVFISKAEQAIEQKLNCWRFHNVNVTPL